MVGADDGSCWKRKAFMHLFAVPCHGMLWRVVAQSKFRDGEEVNKKAE